MNLLSFLIGIRDLKSQLLVESRKQWRTGPRRYYIPFNPLIKDDIFAQGFLSVLNITPAEFIHLRHEMGIRNIAIENLVEENRTIIDIPDKLSTLEP